MRGTTRDSSRTDEIEAAGIEAAIADPDRVGTVLDHVADVAIVCWLLGSAEGPDDAVATLNGPRLERLLEELVDTPVRGVASEAGEGPLAEANARWRIPFAMVEADPGDHAAWVDSAESAVLSLVG